MELRQNDTYKLTRKLTLMYQWFELFFVLKLAMNIVQLQL